MTRTGGATGDIIMDDNADRIPDYWLFDLRDNDEFAIIAETSTTSTSRRRRRNTDITRVRTRSYITDCPPTCYRVTQSWTSLFITMHIRLLSDVDIQPGSDLGRRVGGHRERPSGRAKLRL